MFNPEIRKIIIRFRLPTLFHVHSSYQENPKIYGILFFLPTSR